MGKDVEIKDTWEECRSSARMTEVHLNTMPQVHIPGSSILLLLPPEQETWALGGHSWTHIWTLMPFGIQSNLLDPNCRIFTRRGVPYLKPRGAGVQNDLRLLGFVEHEAGAA